MKSVFGCLLSYISFLYFLLGTYMMDSKEILFEIKKIESEDISYDEKNEDYFGFIEGNIPVLISAPHGAKHKRLKNGEEIWKHQDDYTSSIAIVLGKLTGAHVIYVKNKTPEDSNYFENTKYKDKIKHIVKKYDIRFLMDLHGMVMYNSFGFKRPKICIGIRSDNKNECSCPKFKSIIEEIFKGFQDSPLFNKPFKAVGKNTITSFVRMKFHNAVEVAQFEIREDYRVLETNPDNVLQMLKLLKNLIIKINS